MDDVQLQPDASRTALYLFLKSLRLSRSYLFSCEPHSSKPAYMYFGKEPDQEKRAAVEYARILESGVFVFCTRALIARVYQIERERERESERARERAREKAREREKESESVPEFGEVFYLVRARVCLRAVSERDRFST